MSKLSRIRTLAKAGGALCLLLALLLLALHSGPARRYALGRLTAALASQQIDFQADALRYNLFTLSLDVRNVRLRSATPDLPPFATIGRAQLDLSLADLLRRRYVVQSGVVDDLNVHYVVEADGRDNLPRRPMDPEAPQQPLDYLVTSLSAPKARVRYEDRARDLEVVLPSASIELTGNVITRRHRARFEGGAGEVRIGQHDETIDRLSAVLGFDQDVVRLEDVHVETAGARVALDGTLRNAAVPEVDVKVQATVDAARMATLVDGQVPVKGTIAVSATARGRASAPSIEARLSGSNLRFRSLDVADADVRVAYDSGARQADVQSVRLQAPWGRVSASGALALDRDRASRLAADVRGLDLATVMRDLRLPYVVAARADGRVEAAWPGLDYAEASGTSAATLSPTSARAARRSVPLGGRLSVRAEKGVILADLEPLTMAGGRATGRVKVGAGRQLEGQVRVETSDIATLARTVETILGRGPGSLLPAPIEGAVSADANLGGTIDAPSASAIVRAPSLSVGAATGVDVGADLIVTPATVTIADGSVNWNDARARVTGTVGVTGARRLDLAFEADAVKLSALVRAEHAARVSGTLAASGTIRGTLASPTASLTVQGADLAVLDEPFGALSADASLTGREVTLSRLVVEKPQPDGVGRITATGSYHLDNQTYTLDLKSENLRVLALSLPDGSRLSSRVQLSGKAAGSVGAPGGTVNVVLDDAQVTGPHAAALGRIVLAATAVNRDATITATADQFNFHVTGNVRLERPWPMDMDVRVDGLDLEKLPLGARGLATVKGTLRGTPQLLTPDLTVTVVNGAFSSDRPAAGASNIQLRARIAGGSATIERLTGNWGAATIEASGTVPLEVLPPLPVEIPRQGGPATITASIRGLEPGTIPGVPAGVKGVVDLDVEASTSRADLAALEGHVTAPRLELVLDRVTLTQQMPSMILIKGGTATVERLTLSGSGGSLVTNGTVGLVGERPVDLTIDGALDVAALSVLTTKVRTDGTATLKLAARGPLTAPDLTGTFDLQDAAVASDALGLAATDVNARLVLAGSRFTLEKLTGSVNGGTLEGSGTVTFGNGTISDIALEVSATDIAYDAPLELRSLSDATIKIARRDDLFLLTGQVTIKEGGLTSDIDLDDEMFAALRAPRTLDLTEARDPFLDRVRFDIGVATATPVIVDNDLAQGEIDADLRIAGTPYDTGLTGRLTLAEGSLLRLNARRYEVERGIITFVDERRIVPSIDLVLNTKASDYDVRIAVSGTPGRTETSWTSDPPLSEPDVMALVLTGRTVDEMRGEESDIARMQALSYLTGRVGSKFGRGIEQATGLSEVRIEPVLIANETDPTARLTVGQNVTDQMKLIYSTNLTDGDDQIWVGEYDVTRRFQLRGVYEAEDESYRTDFRHDLRFGGDPAPRRQMRHHATIGRLAVTADAGIDEATLRKLFDLEEGDAYDFFAARNGVERIERRYLDTGYLQSRVRLERQVAGGTANLTLRATSGPVVLLQFEGATPPSKIQRQVRTAWFRGVFDTQRVNDSVRMLRTWLMLDKHLQPEVECQVAEQDGQRLVVFRIQPGPRYERVVLAFEGASGIAPDALDKIVDEQKLEPQLFTDPPAVTKLLRRYYREQGYLSAEVDAPRYEFEDTTARVVVPVREGPRFSIGQVTASGNAAVTTEEILSKLHVGPGAPFVPAAAEHSLDRIRDLYWPKGYNDMRSDYSLALDRNAARVDVAYTIAEGRQNVVGEIAVSGNRQTSDRLVRSQVELSPSQPLDLAALARSRQNLYGTGAFSLADITRTEMDDGGNGPRKMRLNVSVREVQPVQLRYGLSYDTEGGLGGILDFSVHNALGKARVFGVKGRYDSEIHEARIYASQPSLNYAPLKTTASIYYREDLEPPTDLTDPFDISRQGASIQQQMRFRKFYIWSYGYRYELATTSEPSLGVGATETVRITPLSGTLTRETRDEVLDASKGTFLSQAFAYSPGWLGSDRPYWKYYGQYFHYFPLRPERAKPFTDEILRTRLVFATGVRVGLARGIGGDVPTSERFYAGGSTTMRGFEQNAVGPIANNVPAGGNASLVLNNELRFPLWRRFDGVFFLDVGNVYPNITDFSLTNLRESAGVGIRLRTPWVVLRGDYGFVLDPRQGERRSQFYFSIGQAF